MPAFVEIAGMHLLGQVTYMPTASKDCLVLILSHILKGRRNLVMVFALAEPGAKVSGGKYQTIGLYRKNWNN